jgi:hypothetical protein
MNIKFSFISVFLLTFVFLSTSNSVFSATLSVSPSTGVYVSGKTFTVKVVVNTEGKPINAAEGTLKFNPQELSVVSIDKSSSIFNLWVTEPTFSNSAGTINFSGGMPSGYTGSAGNIFNITFRSTSASTARLSLTNGSILANDGMGTNILSGMSGGTFTIQAPSSQPSPEVVEYVAPANTPSAPKIKSISHVEGEWSKEKKVLLSWELPGGVVAIRTSLDNSPSTIPTKVYDNPIKDITLDDVSDGVSYFHIQFKNADGWGKITHYKISIDTEKPESFEIKSPENADFTNPVQILKLEVKDRTSGVIKYKIKVDDSEIYEYIDEKDTHEVELQSLLPGYHSVVIEAIDRAGNSVVGTYSFTILAFDKPIFTEYPSEINEDVIPVIRGNTRPNSKVEVIVQKIGSEPNTYNVTSDQDGVFTFIPEGTFTTGVYEMSARSTDSFGAKSDLSEKIRIAVQEPGYIQIGSFLVNLLSVFIPLIAMMALLIFALWFSIFYFKRIKRKISIESNEALEIIEREFLDLENILKQHELSIIDSRKTKKLTKSEEEMISALAKALISAKNRVRKEVSDVEEIVQKNH